jgi:hypothetical protein
MRAFDASASDRHLFRHGQVAAQPFLKTGRLSDTERAMRWHASSALSGPQRGCGHGYLASQGAI